MATYLLLELNEPHFYETDNIDARWKVGGRRDAVSITDLGKYSNDVRTHSFNNKH